MADLEVGGLRRTSSITKDAAKNAEFDAGVLGMRLLYRSVNFDDLSTYNLTYADGASSTSREVGSQVELAAVRHLGGRVAEKGALLVGGRAHA